MFEERAAQLRHELRANDRADRPHVLLNMAATIDGRAAVDGVSGPIGGSADHEWFHALRSSVDAVMVATGTLRSERYGRLVRVPERRAARAAAGLAEDPLAVVLTRSGDVPWEAPMFAAPEQDIVVFGPARPLASIDVEVVEETDERAILHHLRDRGIRSVLCEGGPTLNASLLRAGLVDELFLTIGPLLAGGDAPRIVEGVVGERPTPARLMWVLEAGDELLLRYALG